MKKGILKRTIAIFMGALLFTALCLSNGLGVTEYNALIPENDQMENEAIDAQVVQETLYVLYNNKLVSLVPGQEEPEILIEEPLMAVTYGTFLLTDGEALYLLNNRDGALYRLEGAAFQMIAHLDLSKMGDEDQNHSVSVDLRYPVMQNGFLYALYMNPELYPKNEIYRFSIKTGKGEPLETESDNMDQLAGYKDGELLTYDMSTCELVSLDAATGKPAARLGVVQDGYINGLAYDAKNDKIYMQLNSEIVLWENQKPETVDYLSAELSNSLFSGIWNKEYINFNNKGMLYLCNTTPGQSNAEVITVWYQPSSFLYPEIFSKFTSKNPQNPVAIRGTEGMDPLKRISTAAMAGDDSIDIFMVPGYSIDNDSLFSRGYAAPIDSEALKSDVKSMYPQIQDYLTRDGVLYGYPAQFELQFFTVCPDLLAQAGFASVPATHTEYYDMMLEWYEENYSGKTAYTFDGKGTALREFLFSADSLISKYIEAYADVYIKDGKPLSFNVPIFRAALEKISGLKKWEKETNQNIVEAMLQNDQCIFRNKAISPLAQWRYPQQQAEEYIFPPSFEAGDQQKIAASMSYFIINPASKKKEAAMRLLTFISENMDDGQRISLHPNDNEPIESFLYQSHTADYRSYIATAQETAAFYESNISDLKVEIVAYEAEILELNSDIQGVEETLKLLTDNGILTDENEKNHRYRITEFQQMREPIVEKNTNAILMMQSFEENLAIANEEIADYELLLAQEEKRRWVISAEDIALYRQFASYMKFSRIDIQWPIRDAVDASSIMTRYFEGDVTLDQVINKLDSIAEMIYYETN